MAGEEKAIGVSDAGRLMWVDAAKGVGILLVVAGHVWWRPGPVHHLIYAFHMPLFFILSGTMVRPQPMARLVRRQGRSLLLPFALFSLLLIGTDMLVEGMRGHRPIFSGWGAGIATILLRTDSLRGPFTILWFVPCLFLARLCWNAVALRWPDPRDWRWAMLVALVMAAGQWITARTVASPLGIAALPAAFACYWIGQLWRARPPGPLTLGWLIPLAMTCLTLLPSVNLKPGDFGMPVLSLAGAAAVSIILCLAIGRLPSRVMAPLAWLGRASLVIMYVHVAFIHYLTPYIGPWMLFLVALVGSLALHAIAGATRPGRALLLGE